MKKNLKIFGIFLVLYILGYLLINLFMGLFGLNLMELKLPLTGFCNQGYEWSFISEKCVTPFAAFLESLWSIFTLLLPFILAFFSTIIVNGSLFRIVKKYTRQ